MMVTCPRCGKAAEFSAGNPYRPFCSKRCKDSDLYGWLTEDKDEKDASQPAPEDDFDGALPAPSPTTRQ